MSTSKKLWRSGTKLVLTAAVILPLLTACVSSGKYDALMEEKVDLEHENLAIMEELHIQDAEITQMQQEQDELAEDLSDLLVAGMLKMELLADGLHLILSEEVLFGSGETQLHEKGEQVIGQVVDELAEIPYQIVVTGSTDSVPVGEGLKDRYPSNWEIAGARAASVVRLMESKGIPSAQLAAVSFGSARPIASNDTPEGRAENRSIEIRLRPVVRQ